MGLRVWALLFVSGCGLSGCGDAGADSHPPSTVDDSATSHTGDVPPALELEGHPAAGETIFEKTCADANCHGPDGSGGSTNAEDLRKVVPLLSDLLIVEAMTDGYLVMPPQRLEDQEMADVLAYLRQRWGGG